MIEILEGEKEAREKLQQTLTELIHVSADSLIRTSELGTALDFSQGVPVFKRTIGLFKGLSEANLDNVPEVTLKQLISYSEQAIKTFEQILKFDPSGENNPASVRDSYIQQVADQYPTFFSQISPVIAYSVRKGTDFDRLEREARNAIEEINKNKREYDTKSASLIAEAESTLEQVRRAAAEVGVAQHAIHFKQEAEDHRSQSKLWLIATIILAILTIGFAVYNIYYYSSYGSALNAAQSIQLAVSKIAIFSVLYFAVIWSGKVFRSQWHNYVVNKHRQNALSTFETFVKAANDDQTKNAVLIQATQSIFSPQNTGFVNQDSDGNPSPQILEIIRGVSSGK